MKKEEKQPMVFLLEDLKEEAEKGNGLACYLLGRSYVSEENGATQNLELAIKYYQKGKELEDPRCIYGMGACYYFGDGVKQDKEKAKELFIQAYHLLLDLIEKENECPAKQAFSKFCLGAYYYFGLGNIEKDEKKAFELIYDCAMQGHVAAIYDLGANFYYNGVGTKKDLKLSRYYLEIAMKTGLPRAKDKYHSYQKEYEEGEVKCLY